MGKDVDVSLAALDLTVLTLGAFDSDKVHVYPTVPHLSLQQSNQTGVADTQTCVLYAATCQMMMWMGIAQGVLGF